MIKIEFPANRPDIAAAIGIALATIGANAADGPGNARGDSFDATVHDETDYRGGPANEYDEFRTNESAAGDTGLDYADGTPGDTAERDSAVVSDDTASAELDPKGVPFNAEMCAKAAKPFYASGPRKDQWKKKGGAGGPTDEAYDDWYAGALSQVKPVDTSNHGDGNIEVDTSAAFGNGQQQAPTVPGNTGEFMGWVSAKQAAELLNQDEIAQAYAELEIGVAALFPPNEQEDINRHVHNLHNILIGICGV